MPKSYLHNEPACQRAERNCFDPYLQVSSRLRALESMGHVTDKIELIVLGGTWNDYPESYRIWFVRELFRALNDAEEHGSAHDRNDRSDNGNDDSAAADTGRPMRGDARLRPPKRSRASRVLRRGRHFA